MVDNDIFGLLCLCQGQRTGNFSKTEYYDKLIEIGKMDTIVHKSM